MIINQNKNFGLGFVSPVIKLVKAFKTGIKSDIASLKHSSRFNGTRRSLTTWDTELNSTRPFIDAKTGKQTTFLNGPDVPIIDAKTGKTIEIGKKPTISSRLDALSDTRVIAPVGIPATLIATGGIGSSIIAKNRQEKQAITNKNNLTKLGLAALGLAGASTLAYKLYKSHKNKNKNKSKYE